MMGGCHKHFHNIIILDGLHSLNSLTATVLTLKIIGSHALDIANFCHGNDRIGFRNQIFHGNIKLIVSDLGSSVIAIFICNFQNFCADNCKKFFLICKNCLEFRDLCHEVFILVFEFLTFQTGQGLQTHINNCLCLCIR